MNSPNPTPRIDDCAENARATAERRRGGCALASECAYPSCWIEADCAHLAWSGDGLPTAWRDE